MKEAKSKNFFEKLDFKDSYSINQMFHAGTKEYLDFPAIHDPYNQLTLTYRETHELIERFAAGLQSLGIGKGDAIALFSENNGRWIIVDQGILKCGAINVVRGVKAPNEELLYILHHSDSRALICQDIAVYQQLKEGLHDLNLRFIILMFKEAELDLSDSPCPILSFEEVCSREYSFKPVTMERSDSATIMYTSGTTGYPKGVLLTHGNLMYQIEYAHDCVQAMPGESSLQVLPVWHAYERIGQYYYLVRGCHLHFTNVNNLKEDLVRYHLDHMMSVPRIWESVREGIYKKLEKQSKLLYQVFKFAIYISSLYKMHKMYGERRLTNEVRYTFKNTVKHKLIRAFYKPLHLLFNGVLYKKIKQVANLNFKAIISGGGALSMQDELFYDILQVNLRIGYGLTETAPVLTLRSIRDKNFLGSAGKPLGETELKIVDPVTLKELPSFEKGLVVVRGPQVMKGYHKDKEATEKVFLEGGWFITGDLGWLTNDNNLVLVGRLKETIVLSSGENVEPLPIEEACLVSPYIDQMMLVGQDKACVGALVFPSKLALDKCGISSETWASGQEATFEHPGLNSLLKHEITTRQVNKHNLRVFEKVRKFVVIRENFNIENGLLSQTLKIKRNKVYEKYHEVIEHLYK